LFLVSLCGLSMYSHHNSTCHAVLWPEEPHQWLNQMSCLTLNFHFQIVS
jgi:hypothetical protein